VIRINRPAPFFLCFWHPPENRSINGIIQPHFYAQVDL
jgi:hypothetical protein